MYQLQITILLKNILLIKSRRYTNNILERIGYFSFTLLSIIILCNLNAFVFSLTQIHAPLSNLILILSLITITTLIHKAKFLVEIKLYFIFFFSYIFFGIISGMLHHFSNLHISLIKIILDYISATIIILSFYIGFQYSFNKKPNTYNNFLSIVLFVTLVYALLQFLTLSLSGLVGNATGTNRTMGLFSNPNELGGYGNFTLLWYLFLFYKSKNIKRIIYLLLIVLSITVISISLSKSAILIGLTTILLYNIIMVVRIRQSKWFGRIFTLCVLITLTTFIFNIEQFFDLIISNFEFDTKRRIESISKIILEGKIDSSTTTLRTIVWKMAMESILKEPLLGLGLGSMQMIPGFGMGVHNTFLVIIGESGIIPLLLFIIFMFYLIIRGCLTYDVSIQFFIIGFAMVFFGQYCMSSHYVLYNKTTLSFLCLFLSILSCKRNSFLYMQKRYLTNHDIEPNNY